MSEIPLRPWEQHDYQVWRPDGTFIICPDAATAALVVRLVNAEAQVVEVLDGLDREIQARADDLARPGGGMRVPFHGDFASAGPGVINRLRWWSKELRNALRGDRPVDGGVSDE